jgi:hypothetical protein
MAGYGRRVGPHEDDLPINKIIKQPTRYAPMVVVFAVPIAAPKQTLVAERLRIKCNFCRFALSKSVWSTKISRKDGVGLRVLMMTSLGIM